MCGRFTLRTPLGVLIERFDLDVGGARQLALFEARYNIAPTQDVLVVRETDVRRKSFGDRSSRQQLHNVAGGEVEKDMPTDDSFTPPKKKPNVLWWIGGAFVLLVFLFFMQLFGPNPQIMVSRQTTYITTPLGEGGLPDYEQHVLDTYREGITPENNAAVLLWQAMWPGELDQKDYAAVATELGLEQIPSADDSLVPLHSKANQAATLRWLRERNGPATTNDEDESEFDIDAELALMEGQDGELAVDVITQATSQPWTSEQFPPLAKWAAANKKPLDLLVEASERPRCYFPSPSLLNRENESLIQMLLPGPQGVREAGRSLSARAMWHAGEGRFDEAWQDLLAAQRIGRLTAQGKTLVEQLVGMAIVGIANEGTLAMLDQEQLTAQQARKVRHDLAALPEFDSIADSLDSMERLSFLDACTRVGVRRNREMMSELGVDDETGLLSVVSVNWNVVLRKGNEYYDRFVAAARLKDRKARERAYAQIDKDLMQLIAEVQQPTSLVAGAISPQRRSEIMASAMLGMFLPALSAVTNAEDRSNAKMKLTWLAAALAEFRAEHGAYPEKLDELAPGVLEEVPVDLFNGKPFLYKRTKDGYLLYSAGENGIDDGGSSQMLNTLKGREIGDLPPEEFEKLDAQIPADTDDHAIRMPRMKWEPPKLPPTAEAP